MNSPSSFFALHKRRALMTCEIYANICSCLQSFLDFKTDTKLISA